MTPLEDVNALKDIVVRMMQFISQFDDVALGEMYEWSKTLEALSDTVREELKRRCRFRGQVAGWTMSLVQGMREIKDVAAAGQALSGLLSKEEFDSCCSVSLTKLEKALCQKRQAATGGQVDMMQCRDELLARLGGLVTHREDRQVLLKNGRRQ